MPVMAPSDCGHRCWFVADEVLESARGAWRSRSVWHVYGPSRTPPVNAIAAASVPDAKE